MHIVVDATTWRNTRGYGRHIRKLFTSLVSCNPSYHYSFIIDGDVDPDAYPRPVNLVTVPVKRVTTSAASADSSRTLTDLFKISKAISNPDYDLVIFPTVYSYVPVYSRAKVLLIIHDAIPETYPGLTLPTIRSRAFWTIKSALARRQADAIITVSEYSRQTIAQTFQLSPEKIFVVGEASDPVFRVVTSPHLPGILTEQGISHEQRLIVYVGGFGPHKNLTSLVDVFARLVREDEFRDVRLVLVGEYQKETFFSTYKELASQVDRLNLAEQVVFSGYLLDEELVELLNLAAVLVLPSLMEGFGLPAVEAAACGCPVIATRESPLPELLGEGGIYIDPGQPEELAAALRRVLSSVELRRSMGLAGQEAAGALTWEQAADQLVAVIETVLNP